MVFGEEIVKRYMRKPNHSTFEKLPHTWLGKRKEETYGKLELMTYEDYLNEFE